MLRLVLILFMLIQPIQWAWANVHITADAAHAVSHDRMPAVNMVDKAFESAASCSLLDDGANSHSCHDNHFHYTTVLGLGGEAETMLLPGLNAVFARNPPAAFNSVSLEAIERPKWFAAR